MILFQDLPIDIIYSIAATDPDAWYKLTRVLPEFRQNAWTEPYRRKFGELFTTIETTIDGSKTRTRWILLGKTHRELDQPAEIVFNDFIYRYDHRIPFISGSSSESAITHYYKISGKTYRDNGKPSIIGYYNNGAVQMELWMNGDEFSREDDLPVRIIYYYQDIKAGADVRGHIRSESWAHYGAFLCFEVHKPGVTERWAKSGELLQRTYEDSEV